MGVLPTMQFHGMIQQLWLPGLNGNALLNNLFPEEVLIDDPLISQPSFEKYKLDTTPLCGER